MYTDFTDYAYLIVLVFVGSASWFSTDQNKLKSLLHRGTLSAMTTPMPSPTRNAAVTRGIRLTTTLFNIPPQYLTMWHILHTDCTQQTRTG